MNEPITVFHDKEGTRLSRWAIKAGMLITETTYDAPSGCLDVTVETPEPETSAEDNCPKCGQDLNDTRHGDAHQWEGGCPNA